MVAQTNTHAIHHTNTDRDAFSIIYSDKDTNLVAHSDRHANTDHYIDLN